MRKAKMYSDNGAMSKGIKMYGDIENMSNNLAVICREAISRGVISDGEMGLLNDLLDKTNSIMTSIHSLIMHESGTNFRDKSIWSPLDIVSFVTYALNKDMKDIGPFLSNKIDIVVIKNKSTGQTYVCKTSYLIHILEACLFVFLKHYGRSVMYHFVDVAPVKGFLKLDEGTQYWKKFCDVFFYSDSFDVKGLRTFCNSFVLLPDFEDTFDVKFFTKDIYNIYKTSVYPDAVDISEEVDSNRGYEKDASKYYNLSLLSDVDNSTVYEANRVYGLSNVAALYLNTLSEEDFARVYSLINKDGKFAKGTSDCTGVITLCFPDDKEVLSTLKPVKRNGLLRCGKRLKNGCLVRVTRHMRGLSSHIQDLESELGRTTKCEIAYFNA